jgi:RND family efflux transporter MFP subunit
MVAVLLLFGGCGTDDVAPSTAPETRVSVEVITAVPASFTEHYTVSALAEPIRVYHLSAEVGGTLAELNVDVGDRVSAGQRLAALDAEPLTLARDTAQASADRADVRVSLAQKSFARQQRLHGQGSVADAVLEEAELNLRLAKADLRLAGLALQIAQRDLGHAHMLAPMAGEITARFPELGEVLAPGTPVLHLARTDRVRLVAALSEAEVVHVRTGTDVQVSFDALPSLVLTGRVARVGSVDRGASPSFPVEIHMDNTGGQVRPGMVARVALAGRTVANAVPVPVVALRRSNGNAGVFVVTDGQANWVPVSVAALVDETAHVDAGLSAGAQIVVVGQTALKGGEAVVLSVVDGKITDGVRKAPAVYGLP